MPAFAEMRLVVPRAKRRPPFWAVGSRGALVAAGVVAFCKRVPKASQVAHSGLRLLISHPSGSARAYRRSPTCGDSTCQGDTLVQPLTYTFFSKTVVLASASPLVAGGCLTEPSLIEYSLPWQLQ
jgi:hypothetical protein